MKKIITIFLFLQFFLLSADIFESFGFGSKESTLNVVIGADKAHEDITHLKNILAMLQIDESSMHEDILTQSEKCKNQIAAVEAGKFGENQYTSTLMVTLKSLGQTLSALRALKKELLVLVKQHIELLQDSLKSMGNLEQDALSKKSFYDFEAVQELEENIAEQQKILDYESNKKREAASDVEVLQKKCTVAEKIYRDKSKEQAEFSKDVKVGERHVKAKSELLDVEARLAFYEKEMCLFRIKEKEARFAYQKDVVLIEERKLQMLKKKFDFVVRVALRIDWEDVRQAEDRFKQQKEAYLTKSENDRQALELVIAQEEDLKKELILLEKSFNEPGKEVENLDEWVAVPRGLEGLSVLAELGLKNDELLGCQSESDVLKANIELEKGLFKEKELTFDMISSWYKVKHQRFKTRDELFSEIKKYQDMIIEFSRDQATSDEKRAEATNHLNTQNHALVNLKRHKDAFQAKYKNNLDDTEKTDHIFSFFEKAQQLVTKQIENAGHAIEAYSKLIVLLNKNVKHAESMVAELQRVSLWQRSRGAISWEGIKNIGPDIENFLSDVHTLGSHSFFSSLIFYGIIDQITTQPLHIALWLLRLFFFFFLFLLFSYMLPYSAQQLLGTQRDYWGIYVIGRVLGFLCNFLYSYRISLFVWGVFFYYVAYVGSLELFISILFYLISIFYLLYISSQLVHRFVVFNTQNKYDILNESFQPRFSIILSLFLYATVIIVCFREAFLLGSYSQSEVPNILLALYSIILRGLLLVLIRKEDLLSFIPSKTPLWAWVWNGVNNYYYSLLSLFIILMILSDPHIGGYDNLMSYLFWGVLGTALVVQSLILFYGFVRRTTVTLFFSSEREILKERFYSAKTIYSVIAILLLTAFIFIGIWLILWFWGRPLSFTSLTEFFTQQTLLIGLKDGQYQHKLSLLDVLRTFSFIPLSFMIAAFVDKFVLYRIFGMLLVDPGVHNTVATITYYLTVLLVITLGLLHEGFGFMVVYYIGPLLFGLAWALRDIFNDFVAYFILLVQRPLKVGDYIKIDEEIAGVVRRITPRCVVLRRQNSFSMIVPNAKMMTSVISNWDYSKSFIAFPDIIVSVRYFEDPSQVRMLLLKAIDQTDNILKNPTPVVRLEDFGVNGFVFLVRAFISSEKTLEQWDIASNVRFSIVKTLQEQGIDLSFPIQIIHIKNDGKIDH